MTQAPQTPQARHETADAVLEIRGLSGGFTTPDGQFTPILHDVGFAVARGTITAIVGETGSGKSMTMLSVLGLAPRAFSRTGGVIRFDGAEIGTSERELRRLRGKQIAIVFQNSRSALNPVFTIGNQLADVIRLHRGVSKKDALVIGEELLARVKVSEPRSRLRQYPHELSGGTAQRVQLAIALACEPSLLILDEPTTGLDVTIQADVLDLIAELNRELRMTTLMITHDLGVVATLCHDVVVMRRGEVCETGTTEQILTRPSHPYTVELLAASRVSERKS